MALEETPDSQQGTPGADASGDWQKRYTDLQSEYTRSQQENTKLRQYQQWADALQGDDPQAAQEAADNLGLSFVNDDDTKYDDPIQQLANKVEQLERNLGSREQQEQQAAREAQDLEVLDRGLGSFEQRIGRKLEQGEVQLLVSHAVVNRDENGAPGIDAAIGLYDGLDKNSQSRWVNTKRVSVPSVGQEGEEAPALDTHAERVADMTAKFLANER
jgi:hypothetical protein